MPVLQSLFGRFFGGSGAFDAGQSRRRLRGFQASRAHINTLIAEAGPTIAARARHLYRNNAYYRRAVNSFGANVIGTGIVPLPELKNSQRLSEDIVRLWLDWTDEADAEGITDFYGLQRRAAREFFQMGEVFGRIRFRRLSDGLTVPMQVQLLPSEQLPLDMNEDLPSGNIVRQGIEFDAIGRRVAYHFFKRRQMDATDTRGDTAEKSRVPAEEVVHLFDPQDGGQIRGVSSSSAAIVPLFLLGQVDDATLDKVKVAALHALVITSAAPADDFTNTANDPLGAPSDDRFIDLQPGSTLFLEPGEDAKVAEAADAGDGYEDFQYRLLTQISAALGVPYMAMTGDMKGANYSSARIALTEARREWEAFQHSVFIYQFCRPIYLQWLRAAAGSGALKVGRYADRERELSRVKWLPPKWDWVDPESDAKAEMIMIDGLLKSRTQATAERGYDARQVEREIAEERQRERDLQIEPRGKDAPVAEPPPANDDAPAAVAAE